MARDDRGRPDESGREGRVVAVHRVVAADRKDRDVDRMAPRDQLHVAEEAGVAGVVDRLAADRDDEPCSLADRGAVVRAERRHRPSRASCSCGRPGRASPSPSRTRPCRRGSGRTCPPRLFCRASPRSRRSPRRARLCACRARRRRRCGRRGRGSGAHASPRPRRPCARLPGCWA